MLYVCGSGEPEQMLYWRLQGRLGAASRDRTHTRLSLPASYRLHVAMIASNAQIPVHDCTLLHAREVFAAESRAFVVPQLIGKTFLGPGRTVGQKLHV